MAAKPQKAPSRQELKAQIQDKIDALTPQLENGHAAKQQALENVKKLQANRQEAWKVFQEADSQAVRARGDYENKTDLHSKLIAQHNELSGKLDALKD